MSFLTGPIFLALAGIISITGFGMAGYALWQIRRLNRLRKTLFSGTKGEDLEEVIHALYSHMTTLRDEHTALENNFTALRHDFGFAVQKIGVIRFNPFSDGGGNLSFTVALLDGHDTGLVITSMYGREQNRIYTKRIREGDSEAQLTDEEQQAIAIANRQ